MVVLTDGEKDDLASMVRFLLYTSDFDVDGVIQVNARWQPNGHSNEHWYETEIDKYEEVYPNLIKHNANYPTPERLRSIMRVGNENKADLAATPSRMKTTNTPGEQLIVQLLLDDDTRPIQFECWGGIPESRCKGTVVWNLVPG